ncbi:MAG: hypothetical protein ABIU63_18090 [Chitinophagaceae bacterium]
MCNCGNKRNELNHLATHSQSPIPTQKAGPGIGFVYTGQSALTVTGNVTRKQYRFNSPGSQQLVDYRDANALMMVPVLKRIS